MTAPLPCPFCGGEPEVSNPSLSLWAVSCCPDHGTKTLVFRTKVWGSTRFKAIAAWNTRAPVLEEAMQAVAKGVEAVAFHKAPEGGWMGLQQSRLLSIILNRQSEDEALWIDTQGDVEEYLQSALRELHTAVESASEESPWRKWPGDKPAVDEEVWVWTPQSFSADIHRVTMVIQGKWADMWTRSGNYYLSGLLHPHWLPLSAIPGPEEGE